MQRGGDSIHITLFAASFKITTFLIIASFFYDFSYVHSHILYLRFLEGGIFCCSILLIDHSFSARNRSASNAAMQPVPAALIACLYFGSATSPAAKTPGILVAVLCGCVFK